MSGLVAVEVLKQRLDFFRDKSAKPHCEDSAVLVIVCSTISTSNRNFVIERERILIDGTEFAKLPPEARTIELTATDNKLTVRADCTVIVTKQLHD